MDGAPPQDDNIDALPLEQRLSHKVWKARLSAYTEIASLASKTVDDSDPLFRQHYTSGQSLRDWVRDANAVAQEKGVEAACAVVEYGGKTAARSRPDVVPSIVEKCLGSARAGTRTKAIELCMLYIEAEEDMAEGVIGDVVPGLDAKQPKVVAGAVIVLKEAVRCFGPKSVNVKPILKTLPKIFAHADKTVRSEGQLLCLALHSYLGPALTPHLGELKPVQQKELGEAFEAADRGEKGDEYGFGKIRPSRYTASQKRAMAIQEAQGQLDANGNGDEDEGATASDEATAEEPEAAMDPYDLADPIPVLSRLPEDFYSNLSSSKWKDRKELALEPLLATLASSLRYQPDNYTDVVAALAGRMGDANVLCVVLAAQCIEKLARGLRGDFARYKSVVTAPILGKLKEKKQNVQDALGSALDAIAASTSIGDFTEDVTTFAKDKNPSVKASTLSFYTRCLCSTITLPPKGDLPELVESMKKALEDSDAGVRAAAADALGTLLKVVGERAFNALAGDMDPLRKEKVTEAAEKAVTKCKNGIAAGGGGRARAASSRPAPSTTAAPKPRPRPPPPANKENAPPARAAPSFDDSPAPPTPKPPAARGPPARLLAQKAGPPASTARPPAPAAAKKPAPTRAPAAAAAAATTSSGPTRNAEPLRFRHTQEAAESLVDDGEVFPAEIVTQLNDANWKQRLEGMEKLSEWVKLDGRDADAEVVVRYLTGKKPGPKESNFQVAGKVFALLSQLAAESPTWSKAPMAVSIPVLCDKLGDIKLKKPASDALTAFAEKSSLGFVLGQAYETMSKQKAPKTLAESYVFVEQALRDFGLAGGLAVRDLIDFVKVGLKHSNAAVRTAATKTIVTLRLFVGADIVNFLSDLTPQLLSTIESEFGKVAAESPPEPTRVGADTVVAAPPSSAGPASAKAGKAAAGGRAAAAEADPMDELFPRVDFDRLVPSAQIQALGDSAWKVRKEAIEGIRDTLDANKRIKPTTLPDLATALKLRITDANKIIQLVALDIVARLASGMGPPFGQNLARVFAGPVAQVLADQKANIRAAGVTTLTAMADAAGLEGLIGSFDKPLEGNNPVQRKELTAWLEGRLADPEASTGLDLSGLAPGLLACLEDKQTEVRKSATALLPIVIANAGYAVVMDALAKLKPASRSTALPIVEAARSAASALGSKATAAPPPVSRPAAAPSAGRAPPPAAARPPPASAAPPAAPPAAASTAPPPRMPLGLSRPAAKPLRTAAAGPPAGDEPVSSAVPSRLGQPRPRQSVSGLRSAAASSRPMSSASNVSSAASAREPPFRSSDPNQKLVRHKKETGAMKWVIEGTPRHDQVEWLASQMAPQISASLHGQLFSTDHSAERDFLAGLSVMDECAKDPASAGEACDISEDEMRERLVANFDLIVKYLTLRLALTSTVITIKCLDLIDHLIPVLSKAEYRASDYEALPLLISLVNKVGDSKETIRQRVRAIFKTICSVYPFSKVFSTIFDHGLDNKNARVRSECIEELGQLYSRHGAKIYPISQALPKIASNIGKPDATTRTAALHAIGAVYTLVGPDATWKAVGNLPAKDRSMLEERLKRTASGAASPMPPTRTAASTIDGPPGTPGGLRPPTSRLAVPASPSPAASGAASLPSRAAGLPRPGGIPSRLARPPSSGPQPASTVVRANMPPPPSRPLGSAASRPAVRPPAFTEDDLMAETVSDLPSLLDALDTNDFNACSDVLKLVTREITKNTEQVLPHVDALIDAVTARMELGFAGLTRETSPAQLRLCKHLMQVLSALFDKRVLAQKVSRLPLTGLLADLTGRLLDTADNPVSEPIQSLSKVLNMVLIRIFHNADQNVCFGALLTVLQDATIDLRELQGDELADRAKYAELVMKCLWKVSKTVKESLENQQLRAPRLLSDINQFLITIPPAEWRRRANDDIPLADMPLRTVKTILQQVVSVMKEKVFNELDEIDQAENSFVYQYLYRLANQLSGGETALRAEALARKASASSLGSATREEAGSAKASTDSSSAQSTSVAGPAHPPASSPGGTDIAVNQRLKEIFELIGDPSHSRSGIAALYEFQKDHPEASARIATWMAGTGSYFQTYLKRALANLEAADRERTLEMPMDGSPEQAASRPSSGASRSSNAVPGTPTRSSRASINPNVTTTPKLQELRSMFGLTDKEQP